MFNIECSQWMTLLLHSARDSGSIPGWVTACAEFAHSPRVCVVFHRVLRFPPTLQTMCWLGGLATLNCTLVSKDVCKESKHTVNVVAGRIHEPKYEN